MASINPLEFFSIGEKIGRVNSPVSGIGGAIRRILDDARKKGLVRAQAEAQGEASRATELYKSQLKEEAENRPMPAMAVGPGGRITAIPGATRGTKFVTEPAMNDWSVSLQDLQPGGSTTPAPTAAPSNLRGVSDDELIKNLPPALAEEFRKYLMEQ